MVVKLFEAFFVGFSNVEIRLVKELRVALLKSVLEGLPYPSLVLWLLSYVLGLAARR